VTHYLYVHRDTRQAWGLSTWVAMAKAIGRDEAQTVLETAEPLAWGQTRTPPPSINGNVRKVAFLYGPDSQRLGTFYEMA